MVRHAIGAAALCERCLAWCLRRVLGDRKHFGNHIFDDALKNLAFFDKMLKEEMQVLGQGIEECKMALQIDF